jgi:hypothetical protein
MLQLIGRRLLATVPLLLAVSVVVFSFIHLLPGDPAVLFLGEEATPENLARFRAKLGFDRPLVVQYGEWLGHAVQGDLGRSVRTNQPVVSAIVERLPVTLRLIGMAMLISLSIALPLGTISAVKRNSGVDLASTFFALAGFLHAQLLAGPDPHLRLRARPALAPALGLRWRALARPALDHARHRARRPRDAPAPLGHARGAAAGLRPHRRRPRASPIAS